MEGYIKLYRSLLQWEWYQDANTSRVFQHLLLNANHADGSWKGVKILAGQLVTSSTSIAAALRLSRQAVRTALLHLKSTGEITIQTTNNFILVTIANWASYQDTWQKSTIKLTSQATLQQPANNHGSTTNKNDKNDKNDKNTHGEFENVRLSDSEYAKLKNEFPDYERRIEALSQYMASKGKSYKNHYATILSWSRNDKQNKAASITDIKYKEVPFK